MTEDRKGKTIEYYDRDAEGWTKAHHGEEMVSYWKSEMERFHNLLPQGRILEIGSGAESLHKNSKSINHTALMSQLRLGLKASPPFFCARFLLQNKIRYSEIAMSGLEWNIVYYESSSGDIPVYDFIESLNPTVKSKVSNTFDLLTEYRLKVS